MNMTKLVLASLALVTLAAPAFAEDPVFTASGSYLASDGVSYGAFDACGTTSLLGTASPQEGADSNCVALPGDYSGLAYTVTSSDLTGTASVEACFYDATGAFLDCPVDGVVPAGSVSAALSSLTGVQVSWTLTIG